MLYAELSVKSDGSASKGDSSSIHEKELPTNDSLTSTNNNDGRDSSSNCTENQDKLTKTNSQDKTCETILLTTPVTTILAALRDAILTLTNIAKIALSLSMLATWIYLLNHDYTHRIVQVPIADLRVMIDVISAIKPTHSHLQQALRKELKDSGYTVPGFGTEKFYHEHFEKAFNVRFLDDVVYKDPTIKPELDSQNVFISEEYLNYSEYYDEVSELFANYKESILRNRKIYVKFVGLRVGYGVFAAMNLPTGTYLGDYTGVVVRDTPNNDYTWSHTYKQTVGNAQKGNNENGNNDDLYFGIDGRFAGNMIRFINAHLNEDKINTNVVYFIRNGKWVIGYQTVKPIKKGDQLIVSYGPDYWEGRPLFDPLDPDSADEADNKVAEVESQEYVYLDE